MVNPPEVGSVVPRKFILKFEKPVDDGRNRVEPGYAIGARREGPAGVLGGFRLDLELEPRRPSPFFLLLALVGNALAPELDEPQHGVELRRVEPETVVAASIEQNAADALEVDPVHPLSAHRARPIGRSAALRRSCSRVRLGPERRRIGDGRRDLAGALLERPEDFRPQPQARADSALQNRQPRVAERARVEEPAVPAGGADAVGRVGRDFFGGDCRAAVVAEAGRVADPRETRRTGRFQVLLVDFRNIDTRHWDTDGFGNPIMTLVKQKWLFEDSVTLDDIAECIFVVSIMEPLNDTELPLAKLNKSALKKMVLDAMIVVSAYEGNDHADDASWPKISNEFNYQCISRPHLDGLQIQMAAVEGRKPSPYGFIPVDKRFVLSISFAMGTLHYPNRKNPYSNELIRKLEFDLFDEYLQSINLRYTDKTIELIKASA